MPPASSNNSTPGRARLHAKFSSAATALAELYRESSNAYEAGYHDALLFVERYLQLSTPTPSTAAATATAQPPPLPSAHSRTSTLCATVNAAQMMSFLQDTAAARRERMAVVRGVHSTRRRQRDATDTPDGFGEDALEAENNAAAVRIGDRDSSGEDGEEEEPRLTPQSSPASAGPHSRQLHTPHADTAITTTFSSSSPHATLNRDIELITLLEPPVQPHRQRRRTDRPPSAASHRRVRSPRGHPFSLQMPVGRGK